jgi:hypothetical protein
MEKRMNDIPFSTLNFAPPEIEVINQNAAFPDDDVIVIVKRND